MLRDYLSYYVNDGNKVPSADGDVIKFYSVAKDGKLEYKPPPLPACTCVSW